MVKIRRPEVCDPKYVEAFRDRPTLYLTPSVIRPGRALVITEGELDALLLSQELGERAAVLTLGSASARPGAAGLKEMLAAPVWYIATDADEAGDRSASRWPDRALRVRPPRPYKDWTEAHQAGLDLRAWWTDILQRTEAPQRFAWDALAAWRWGPATSDPVPGIVVDRPDRYRMLAAVEVAADDPYAVEERAAIMEFDAGLSRDAAERAAGLDCRRCT
jgi:hypothetical protein